MTAHDRTGGHGSPQGGAAGLDRDADTILHGIGASLAGLAAFTVTVNAPTGVIRCDGRRDHEDPSDFS
jgi:hypothetical protein